MALKIRTEQTKAFEAVALLRFEDYMLEHLKHYAPRQSEILGEKTVREVIRLGSERSAAYGFANRGPVRLFIELMFRFGSYFDTDPQFPWIGAMLSNPQILSQSVRADLLYTKIIEYSEEVEGPESSHLIASLRRLEQTPLESFDLSRDEFDREFVNLMKVIHPQKCRFVGGVALHRAVYQGLCLADEYSIMGIRHRALFVTFALMLGHRFVSDPLYPWISRTLTNGEVVIVPDRRIEQLYAKGKIYLQRALNHLEDGSWEPDLGATDESIETLL